MSGIYIVLMVAGVFLILFDMISRDDESWRRHQEAHKKLWQDQEKKME